MAAGLQSKNSVFLVASNPATISDEIGFRPEALRPFLSKSLPCTKLLNFQYAIFSIDNVCAKLNIFL